MTSGWRPGEVHRLDFELSDRPCDLEEGERPWVRAVCACGWVGSWQPTACMATFEAERVHTTIAASVRLRS